MILPDDRCITQNDCERLIEAIKRGELDELDLKNEINQQWNYGYRAGKLAGQESKVQLEEVVEAQKKLDEAHQKILDTLRESREKIKARFKNRRPYKPKKHRRLD